MLPVEGAQSTSDRDLWMRMELMKLNELRFPADSGLPSDKFPARVELRVELLLLGPSYVN